MSDTRTLLPPYCGFGHLGEGPPPLGVIVVCKADTITLASGANLSNRAAGLILNNLILPTSGTVIFNFDDSATNGGTITVNSSETITGTLTVRVLPSLTLGISPLAIMS